MVGLLYTGDMFVVPAIDDHWSKWYGLHIIILWKSDGISIGYIIYTRFLTLVGISWISNGNRTQVSVVEIMSQAIFTWSRANVSTTSPLSRSYHLATLVGDHMICGFW